MVPVIAANGAAHSAHAQARVTRARPRRRALSGLFLLLHIAITGLLPFADARLEQDAADTVVHMESEDRPPCPTGHDHLKCQICRVAGANLLAARTVDKLPLSVAITVGESASLESIIPTAHRSSPLGARAPPLV